MLKVFLGFLIGYVLAAISQVSAEKDYIKCGVAKINNTYYKIIPLKVWEESNKCQNL